METHENSPANLMLEPRRDCSATGEMLSPVATTPSKAAKTCCAGPSPSEPQLRVAVLTLKYSRGVHGIGWK